MTVRRLKKSYGLWTRARVGLAHLRILVVHGVGTQQPIKIWSLEYYVLWLYSWNIAECEGKQQPTNKTIFIIIQFMCIFYKLSVKVTQSEASPLSPALVNELDHLTCIIDKVYFLIGNMCANFHQNTLEGILIWTICWLCPLWPWPMTSKINKVHCLSLHHVHKVQVWLTDTLTDGLPNGTTECYHLKSIWYIVSVSFMFTKWECDWQTHWQMDCLMEPQSVTISSPQQVEQGL